MKYQRLNNETAEHFELFLQFCKFKGSVEQFFNTTKPNLTLSAIQKIASPKRNNWLARKKLFMQYSNSKQDYDITIIRNNLLNKIQELTAKPETINMQNIEVLTNCFYKLTLINCETPQTSTIENNTQKADTVQVSHKSNKTIPKPKENATVATVCGIFSETTKPAQLPKENNTHYSLFMKFLEYEGSITSFAKSVCEDYNLKPKGIISVSTKHKWTARKNEFLENK